MLPKLLLHLIQLDLTNYHQNRISNDRYWWLHLQIDAKNTLLIHTYICYTTFSHFYSSIKTSFQFLIVRKYTTFREYFYCIWYEQIRSKSQMHEHKQQIRCTPTELYPCYKLVIHVHNNNKFLYFHLLANGDNLFSLPFCKNLKII